MPLTPLLNNWLLNIGIGWSNVTQGMLLEAYLAYLSDRTCVFYPPRLVLVRPPSLFVVTYSKITPGTPSVATFPPTKTIGYPPEFPCQPFSLVYYLVLPPTLAYSIFSGPIAGDPFPPSSTGQPAVMVEFYKKVCPNPTIIDPYGIKDVLREASAATVLQAWLDKLERTEDRCAEITVHMMQIFDFWCVLLCPRPFLVLICGSGGGRLSFGEATRLLNIWPSPIVTYFAWSPLITAALAANAHLIHPSFSLHHRSRHTRNRRPSRVYSRCISGAETSSSIVYTSPAGPHGLQRVPGTTTHSYRKNRHGTARAVFWTLSKSSHAFARCAPRPSRRQDLRAYTR
jgi:hypothetical protein